VKDGARHVTVPIAQAVVGSVAVNAVRGNQRAQQLFTQILNATETADKQQYDEYLKTMIE
jgi:hypothetical protein